ncbi:MAG: DEAD/DEAH box helicase family protein [Rivularia sp. T60_A2020_040]|nr:DEAD/DEAH box helicase family protein [Rivularia sp. T60_A2020_040]
MKTLAPGARIVVRDAEWLIKLTSRTFNDFLVVDVIGVSDFIKGRAAQFIKELEDDLEVLDPESTALVADNTSGYRNSLLFIEAHLRQTAPTGNDLYVGHKAAMDILPYQLDPAIKALSMPRQRLLIADAVGLGKTLEAGILVSELMRRGRAKRILVVTTKSMLTQFQKEFWMRFTIPLVRLDSVGIQRIRSRIPTNHNPFQYYDKAIVSVDTLKQDREYRTYIEQAEWDVIVIDEAHNVARRKSSSKASLRSKLASRLATRSDALIMLSATPHDGRPESFASLMNMLDPTAIANESDYTKDDIRDLYFRRFKKDVLEQLAKKFPERQVLAVEADASEQEERAFDVLDNLELVEIDAKASAGKLFKTTLLKAMLSSPMACLETVRNRIKRVLKKINLHYLSHRLIHFDIPWSLMALQQRNGRIDRYGQESQPQIRYMLTRSVNERVDEADKST